MQTRNAVLFALSVSASALVLTPPRDATAEEPPAPGRAAIGDDLHAYYGSERTTAYAFVALGLASALVGGALVATQRTDFARGLGWSLVGVGALQGVGAFGYSFAVSSTESSYASLLERDPAAYQRDEAAHIHGTTSRFFYYRLTEAAFALAGWTAAAAGEASQTSW